MRIIVFIAQGFNRLNETKHIRHLAQCLIYINILPYKGLPRLLSG